MICQVPTRAGLLWSLYFSGEVDFLSLFVFLIQASLHLSLLKANLKALLRGAQPCHYRTWIEFALSDSLRWNCFHTDSSTSETKSWILSDREATEWAKFPREYSEITLDVTFDLLIASNTISVASNKYNLRTPQTHRRNFQRHFSLIGSTVLLF